MTERSYRWVCLVALGTAYLGAAVGAARWLGPDALSEALEPLGRAPLFVGTLGPILAYALVQALPGGRAPVWLRRPPNDGWTIVLGAAMLCAGLAAWPARRGAPFLEVITSTPLLLVAVGLLIDRQRRVQRLLAGGAAAPTT